MENVISIMGEPGNDSSAGAILMRAQANFLSSENFSVTSVIESKMADEEILKVLPSEVMARYNINANGLAGITSGIADKTKRYLEDQFVAGGLTVEQKTAAEKFIEKYLETCKESGKKKQIVTESQTSSK